VHSCTTTNVAHKELEGRIGRKKKALSDCGAQSAPYSLITTLSLESKSRPMPTSNDADSDSDFDFDLAKGIYDVFEIACRKV
jgi:hypothetical protein